jgi:hypothetical protein
MRLVTRADLDGLTCAVLITSCESISTIRLIHPQDITDRRVEIGSDDILANLPYDARCAKWFDHHLLTASNQLPPQRFDGLYGLAPSAARNVFDYYRPQHPELDRFMLLVDETDRLDAAQLSREDVLAPQGHILLGLTLDPRTGLGAYEDYFRLLLDGLKQGSIDDLLRQPAVQDRVARMRDQDRRFRDLLTRHSRLDGNVVITDFREVDPVPIGNRFIIYTVFPTANISVRIHRSPRPDHIAVAVGHSIFDRSSRTNVGFLMSRFGGGGHRGAGTCLLPKDRAEQLLGELVATMKRDG